MKDELPDSDRPLEYPMQEDHILYYYPQGHRWRWIGGDCLLWG